MGSIKYYDENADAFYARTINADISDLYERFLTHIKQQSKILDAGCGVGRDAKYFLKLGHDVTAFDASKEMVKKASKEIDQNVLHFTFQNIDFVDEFDAIWANASLLHVPFDELRDIIQKFHRALKKDGIFFATFKYGDSKRDAGKRVFFDMNEENILPFLDSYFEPIEIWKSADTRSKIAASPHKAWLNILCKAILSG